MLLKKTVPERFVVIPSVILALLMFLFLSEGLFASQLAQIESGSSSKQRTTRKSALVLSDFPHSMCDAILDLNVGRDYFTHIANELPGKEQYNELVGYYERADWLNFDKHIETFKKAFESSPLIEAALFLTVQTELERVKSSRYLDQVERHFRELLLLYPKSNLIPLISASMSNYWMHKEVFDKSLSLYENARIQFPDSPLQCAYLLGVAESQYQMNEVSAAQTGFQTILEKCFNRRIRTAALLRQLDGDTRVGKKVQTTQYEQVLSHSPLVLEQFYPWVLHNIGEYYFRERALEKAKFYLQDYLRQPGATPKCMASAQKRLGDIALRVGAPLTQIEESYYKAVEFDKDGPLAVYSYLHALLIGYSEKSEQEKRLRLTIFDREVEKISDLSWRSVAFLEKGIAALEAKEPEALNYMIRLHDRETEARGIQLNAGSLGIGVRLLVYDLLTSYKNSPKECVQLLAQLPDVVRVWGAKSQDEKNLLTRYHREVVEFYARNGSLKETLRTISNWRTGPFWPKKTDESLGAILTKYFWDELKKSSEFGHELWTHYGDLKPLLQKDKLLFWYHAALKHGTEQDILALEREFKISPTWVYSTAPGAKTNDSSWLLTRAQLLERLGKLTEAWRIYRSIKDEQFYSQVLTRKFALARMLGDLHSLKTLGWEIIQSASSGEKRIFLTITLDALREVKGWKEILQWDAKSNLLGLSEMDRGLLDYLVGRSAYELRNYSLAAERFRSALSKDPSNAEGAEAFFKLGKCLAKLGDWEGAREVWGGLIEKNDGFWSPLAKNELTLLDRKPSGVKPN